MNKTNKTSENFVELDINEKVLFEKNKENKLKTLKSKRKCFFPQNTIFRFIPLLIFYLLFLISLFLLFFYIQSKFPENTHYKNKPKTSKYLIPPQHDLSYLNFTKNITNNATWLIPYRKKIYVKYVDFWTPFELDKLEIHYLWSLKYDVVFSDNPEYLVYSCFGYSHRHYENAIKLFISLERIRPNFDECDYAISSYEISNVGDRYMRKPWSFPIISKYETIYNISKYWEEKGVINATEKKFCAWVVSNGGCSTRNKFFNMLSKYARVDSGGRYRNNIGRRVNNKMEFLAHYKFSICFENSKENGYGTEKLPQAFNSGTIPIYWGDDSMLEIYNNKSYIHIKDESEFQEKINYIMEIDKNDTLYNEIIHQDVYLDKKKQQRLNDTYNEFIMHIVNQDFDKAKRIGKSKN